MTKTTLTGASALAKKVRVIMSEPGTPEAAYGISGIKVSDEGAAERYAVKCSAA